MDKLQTVLFEYLIFKQAQQPRVAEQGCCKDMRQWFGCCGGQQAF
jgi:hypothetical protein